MTGVPQATYRLQLRAEFGFDDAATVVPYLHGLGISHAYLSPILQAAPGSTHGYDVVARTPELRDDRLDSVGITYDADGAWLVVSRGRFRIVVNLAADAAVVPLDAIAAYQVMAFGSADPVTDGVGLAGHGVAVLVV